MLCSRRRFNFPRSGLRRRRKNARRQTYESYFRIPTARGAHFRRACEKRAQRSGFRNGQGRNNSRKRYFRGDKLLQNFKDRYDGKIKEKGNSDTKTDLLLSYVRAFVASTYLDRQSARRKRPHHYPLLA